MISKTEQPAVRLEDLLELIAETQKLCTKKQMSYWYDETKSRYPGLILDTDLGDRARYLENETKSGWSLIQYQGQVLAVFLHLIFTSPAPQYKVCFDKSELTSGFLDWLNLLISRNGTLILSSSQKPTDDGLTVSNVPLDIPNLLLKESWG